MQSRANRARFALLIALPCLAGCSRAKLDHSWAGNTSKVPVLNVAAIVTSSEFENRFFRDFGHRHHVQVRYDSAVRSVDDRLKMYLPLFQSKSPDLDLCEIDVVWPGILGDDLIDLKPYVSDDVKSFATELIRSYMLDGRLVAVPVVVDLGVLYYRADLLRKYGFASPPETWDELQRMASVIQAGERRARKDFWGYVWEGQAYEGLTCDALEWQTSEGAGNILEPDRTVHVCNAKTILAIKRAASWVGKISPKGVTAYTEDDAMNVWQAGNAAFMREWTDSYRDVIRLACPATDCIGVSPVPRGAAGHRSTQGDIAIGISKYSPNRELAITALKELISEDTQLKRAVAFGSIPPRIPLQERPEVMARTPLHGPAAQQVISGTVARPSLLTGPSYQAVSQAYFTAVHSVLVGHTTAETAMATLEADLVRITGFRPVR